MTPFSAAYAACALWSSIGDDGEPLDARHSLEDFAPEALAKMEADCATFERECNALLECAYNRVGYDVEQAGHDFWLTRNHHGAGFWDRGLGVLGDRLTVRAEAFGSLDVCVGDDGHLWVSPC
jgi:hypothetical protein